MSADRWSTCPKCKHKEEETLRQDWELYLDEDGKFSVEFSASCRKCGFSYKFKHSEKLVKHGYKCPCCQNVVPDFYGYCTQCKHEFTDEEFKTCEVVIE